ncbi:ethanolamine ammonia-lyase subunit EutC [Tumebacillus permanentifrigoris]|uniref:Ethanolamine ammonia-lyase small subunit n=1 Tax=Tumebacillus permanentifrigoris TaxID=378543 RepID=A0A316D791_9BACL|nr:ethanolamine ammonia-lyase subunit EutC [Tumebacillus permanentifrigoris]PWK09665.1 ethanolamine ammonia-lyase light chain [Tumebacillus permanentifrigoris]
MSSQLEQLLKSTPARLHVGGSVMRPSTQAMLKMWADHAAAMDTVFGDVNPQVLEPFDLVWLQSRAAETKKIYLARPDLGRLLHPDSAELLVEKGTQGADVQVLISNGLSSEAINENISDVYPAFLQSCKQYGLSVPQAFYIENGRVALMDEVGELLKPKAVVIFIGERPGLANPASLSAYFCYQPRKGTIEAERMVISNISQQGTPPLEAGAHLGALMRKIIDKQASGINLV